MCVRIAGNRDFEFLSLYDKHISKEELKYGISRERIYVSEEDGKLTGLLRYNLFWDNTPFMNLLFVLETYRTMGYGKELVKYWENQMRALGFKCVMTSTQSDEYAQHFYVNVY